jgi:hypothetical protein
MAKGKTFLIKEKPNPGVGHSLPSVGRRERYQIDQKRSTRHQLLMPGTTKKSVNHNQDL